MKNLYKIINDNNLSDHKIDPLTTNNIILKRDIFYTIKLIPSGNNQIHIIKDWRLGLLGKFIFKNKFREYRMFLDILKKCLEQNDYEIIQLKYFPQSII